MFDKIYAAMVCLIKNTYSYVEFYTHQIDRFIIFTITPFV